MNRSKFSATLSLLLVFLSGTALGAFAYRLYSTGTVETRNVAPPKKTPEDFRRWYVGTLTSQVKLDADQVQKLNVIMDLTKGEMTRLNEKTKPERDDLNQKRDALNHERDAFFDKIRPQYEAIQNHQVDEITKILRPDQISLYAQFRADRDRERERQRKLHDQQRDQQHHKKQ